MPLRSFLKLIIIFSLCPASAQALRLVSLKPNITQTLIALGYQDDVVGITRFCPKPNDSAQVVADYVSLRTEDILRLKPDLVLSSRENSQSRQYEMLQAAGVRVEYLDFQTFPDLLASVEKLGGWLGIEARAAAVNRDLKKRLQDLKLAVSRLKGRRFTIIVQRRPLMVATGATYLSSLLETAGLENSFGRNTIPYPVLDEESLLRAAPDYRLDMSVMTNAADWGKPFLGAPVIAVNIEDFLAAPQSLDALERLVTRLENTGEKR